MDRETEEFNNFMHKVNDVSNIIKKLASNDKKLQDIGNAEANLYLKENDYFETDECDNLQYKIKENRTFINKKALTEDDGADSNTKSKEAFMREVEIDSEKRYKDRLIRTERMETLKKQGNAAFKRGEYEKALVLFNKAIEQIKDSPLLYNNRALTLIKLNLYEKAKDNLENWALRLNEDSLKSWLLLAKTNFLMGDMDEYKRCIDEARERNAAQTDFIREYCEELENENGSS